MSMACPSHAQPAAMNTAMDTPCTIAPWHANSYMSSKSFQLNINGPSRKPYVLQLAHDLPAGARKVQVFFGNHIMEVQDLRELAGQFNSGDLDFNGLNERVTTCLLQSPAISGKLTTACAVLSWLQNTPVAGQDNRRADLIEACAALSKPMAAGFQRVAARLP